MLCKSYQSRNLYIVLYQFLGLSPRNSTLFTRPFLAGKHMWGGPETNVFQLRFPLVIGTQSLQGLPQEEGPTQDSSWESESHVMPNTFSSLHSSVAFTVTHPVHLSWKNFCCYGVVRSLYYECCTLWNTVGQCSAILIPWAHTCRVCVSSPAGKKS